MFALHNHAGEYYYGARHIMAVHGSTYNNSIGKDL